MTMLQVYNTASEFYARFEDIHNEWKRCDEEVTEIINWLNKIRTTTSCDIPDAYDNLLSEITTCEVL